MNFPPTPLATTVLITAHMAMTIARSVDAALVIVKTVFQHPWSD
jgi:hypothetical protein